jgi:hypothetical protein
MIVEQAVTNQVVDMGLLTQTAEPARAILSAMRSKRLGSGRAGRRRSGRLSTPRPSASSSSRYASKPASEVTTDPRN